MDYRALLLLIGGGTGGHIFPNLAVLERVRGLVDPRMWEVRVLVSGRAVDHEAALSGGLVTEAEVVAVASSPWSVKPGGMARFTRDWVRGRRAVRDLVRGWRGTWEAGAGRGRVASYGRSRVVAVATGGFVSGPAVAGVRAEGGAVGVGLVNLDAVPGRAARMLASRVDRVFQVGAGELGEQVPGASGGVVGIGMPLRREVLRVTAVEEAKAGLGLETGRPVLLVTAGSQGARTVNAAMGEWVRQETRGTSPLGVGGSPGVGGGWQVLHLCGRHEGDEAMLRSAYAAAGVRARVLPFLKDMGLAWSAADLAISRAGAGAAGEVWARAVPTLFLPYPFHKDEHQRLNALPLVKAGGAVLLKDRVEPSLNADALRGPLLELMNDAARRAAMRDRLATTWPGDGAEAVARWVVERFEAAG